MLGTLTGKITFKGDRYIILDVAGVGYKLYVTADALSKITYAGRDSNETIQFWTHLYVRETSLDLYGFTAKAEVEFFETLIGISGVGPKSALGILGVAPLDTLKQAISSGDTSYLSKVSGIGKRTAEKIIVELRDKLSAGLERMDGIAGILKDEQDAVEALESMGYSLREAREALKKVPQEITGTEARIKEALKMFGKH